MTTSPEGPHHLQGPDLPDSGGGHALSGPVRPLALVTGVGRTVGIGAGVARELARSGWDIAFTYWRPYDGRMPWGVEPGAADSIGDALGELGVTANVVNPGPVDTGWMSEQVREVCRERTPLGRLGTPRDTAHLVDFLCSPRGQWINGQLLMSNGGLA
ncbi:SDR family oxidoreductase [Streptomyces cucumeris]|uniref:SDR family oxidoreductase n=1 Tax=Streptomyces cucumeris TaxID=2962890 RepID=UPI003D73EAF1